MSDNPLPAQRSPSFLLQAIPWLILAGGVLLSLGLWYDAELTHAEKQRVEFEFQVDRLARGIENRVKSHEQVLRGVVGLFDASDEVDRHEFRAFVAALHLDERYPGIQGVGFSRLIAPSDRAAHVAAVRAEGFPAYRLRPDGERDTYSSIVFLEPFDWRNQRAFGYDMYSEPVRRAAMARARDTGRAALSGKVTLVQETDRDVQAGVLLYMPVSRPPAQAGQSPRFVGWAYSPLRMNDLMNNLVKAEHPDLARRMAFTIHDGVEAGSGALLFALGEAPAGGARAVRRLSLAGQPWTLSASAMPGLGDAEDRTERMMLGAELGITLLIALLASTMIRGHARVARTMVQLDGARRETEARRRELQSIYDASTVGIFLVDRRGTITDANQRMGEMFGRPLDEIVGGEYAALIDPAERERGKSNVDALLAGEIARVDAERRYRRGDGGEFWGHVTGRRHVDPWSGEGRLVGVITDITERKKSEAELARYRQDLEALVRQRTLELAAARDAADAANRAKSVFLAKMSHELRTPMNGIMGMTNLALRRANDPGQADFLRKSLASAERLLALIEDILELSHLEAEGLVLDEAEFDLAQVIGEACALHGDAIRAKGLHLRRHPAADLPARLRGDAVRLRQIVACFVGNAAKFSERGAIDLRLSVADRDAQDLTLRVEVADEGIGMSEAQRARLFNAFVQGDDSTTRKYGGSGLGLTLARRVARLMGGDIEVESQEGVGSTFRATVRLRLVRAAEGGGAVPGPAASAAIPGAMPPESRAE